MECMGLTKSNGPLDVETSERPCACFVVNAPFFRSTASQSNAWLPFWQVSHNLTPPMMLIKHESTERQPPFVHSQKPFRLGSVVGGG